MFLNLLSAELSKSLENTIKEIEYAIDGHINNERDKLKIIIVSKIDDSVIQHQEAKIQIMTNI